MHLISIRLSTKLLYSPNFIEIYILKFLKPCISFIFLSTQVQSATYYMTIQISCMLLNWLKIGLRESFFLISTFIWLEILISQSNPACLRHLFIWKLATHPKYFLWSISEYCPMFDILILNMKHKLQAK